MFRYLSFLTLSLLSLQASGLSRYELLAKEIRGEGDTITASGDVVIYSKENSFRANKAIYHQKSGELELFGDVYISYKNSDAIRLNETKFNLKNRTFESQNIFAYDQKANMWFETKKTTSKKDIYELKDTTISSCDRKDPEWKIKFSDGVYNKKEEYISIYNPTFYAGGVPLLYLPWFGFSTNNHRKSGFLKPIIGYENKDNIFLVTPYFIANEDDWDIELDPQIRINRGLGLYSTLRFVDTNLSKGALTLGYFNDKEAYTKKHNLENRAHLGASFKYENRSLLSEKIDYLKKRDYKDGLLLDLIYLNDIDYVNLNHTTGYASSKLATSKANYVLHDDIDYLGVYAKYFIDTEKKSNADTLQTLPSIQYHRYSNIFKIPNLLYSLDYKFKHNYRREGLRATQHEFSAPITFYKGFFGEYLDFQASENFYYSKVNYYEGNATTDDATYFSNYHKFLVSSDLTKKYDSFIHNLQADLSFVIPSVENRSGYFADFIPFNIETKNVAFKLNQYFYDESGFDFLTHRFVQVYYDDKNIYKYGDSENQIIYKPTKELKLYNTIFYSHEYDRIRKLQSGLNYNKDRYNLRVNHTYEYKKDEKNSDFITTYANAKIDKNYNIFASLDYDFEDRFTKEWSVGWKMKKSCWDYMFRYKESVTPNLTSSGAESVVKRGVLFFVRFSPFGGMAYEFNKETSIEDEKLLDVLDMKEEVR